MFRFEHPQFLWFLAAAPAVVALVWLARWWRRRVLARFGEAGLVGRLLRGFSERRIWLKTSVFALALALLALALANPQRGSKREKVTQKSADIFIALDISQSMLAEDIAPSRLERAKSFAQKLVRALPGQRFGLIFFAGNAYLQMPLSSDYGAAISFLRSASPDMVSEQGTAIGDAIALADQSFDPQAAAGRAVIVITDGETHDENTLDQAKAAAEKGIQIHAIGVGSTTGAPIPLGIGAGGTAFKRDEQGEMVSTRLNEQLLRELADAGRGEALNLREADATLSALRESLERLEKREVEVRSYTAFESYFQWFLLPALVLLVLEFLLPAASFGRKI